MKPISYKLYYDSKLDNFRFPAHKILGNPNSDYPFLLIENFLSNLEAQNLYRDLIQRESFEFAKVKAVENTILKPKLKKSIRNTKVLELNSMEIDSYQLALNRVRVKIEEFFKVILIGSSMPQALLYERGSYYLRHSDSCNELIDNSKELIGWNLVAKERVITTVLFLNSHKNIENRDFFEGGELVFNFLFSDNKREPFSIEPMRGSLIAFPSNPIFSHEVKKVLSGYRLTIAQWHNAIIN